jgi:hypothetical protein
MKDTLGTLRVFLSSLIKNIRSQENTTTITNHLSLVICARPLAVVNSQLDSIRLCRIDSGPIFGLRLWCAASTALGGISIFCAEPLRDKQRTADN